MVENSIHDTPIYDRPSIFENYLQLPRQQKGLDGAPEWPIMRTMIGDLKERRVLDLGCGLGWFARYAAETRRNPRRCIRHFQKDDREGSDYDGRRTATQNCI